MPCPLPPLLAPLSPRACLPLPPGAAPRTRMQGKLDEGGTDVATVQNVMGLVFVLTTFLGMFNCMTVQPVIGAERTVFYRERSSSYYSPGPYAVVRGRGAGRRWWPAWWDAGGAGGPAAVLHTCRRRRRLLVPCRPAAWWSCPTCWSRPRSWWSSLIGEGRGQAGH